MLTVYYEQLYVQALRARGETAIGARIVDALASLARSSKLLLWYALT